MEKLRGIMAPMITPFKQNGDVDYDAFAFNVRKWAQTGMSGLLVLGSNSETPLLSEEEKLELIKITVDNANGKLVMAGTGMETVRETIALTNKAADLGVHCALILTPSFYDQAMTSAALEEYFTMVADGTQIPILLYNVPKFTHVNMAPALIAKLAKHPNIIGLKDSSGDMVQFASLVRLTQEDDFSLFVGTAGALYPALTLGADGGILALANCNPDECVEINNLYHKGEGEASRDLYQRIFSINTAVTATYGISGLKRACELMGYKGGYVRKPLQEVSDEKREEIRRILETAQVI